MAGLINWKKAPLPSSNPDADHLYVGIDSADGAFYIKNSSGAVSKYETTTNVAAAIAAALADYDLSTVVDSKIADAINDLINGAGSALDTLNELAAALGNDPNFATTINAALANRLRIDTAAQGLNSTEKTNAKTNIDLQNVDNTSDANKPVSTAQATAIATAVSNHVALPDPHPQYLTPAEGNAAYAPLSHVGTGGTQHANATTSVAGFQSAADKTKLDGIASGATANSSDSALRDRSTHTGTQAASTISDFANTVRATVLTGLSTATNAVIAAGDSILVALGKLQAQLNQAILDVNATFLTKADKILTGLVIQDAEVVATDEVLPAIGKLQGQINVWQEAVLLNAINNSSNVTLSNITDLTLDVVNGKRYRIEGFLLYRAAATTTGIAFTVSVVGATGTLSMIATTVIGADGTATTYTGVHTASGDIVVSTGVPAANTDYILSFQGIFNCTTTGTIVPQFRSEVNGSQVTVQPGSNIIAREF